MAVLLRLSRQMVDTDNDSFPISRRTLLKAGVLGAGALLFARWIYPSTSQPEATPEGVATLDGNAQAIIASVASVLLKGALPVGAEAAAARGEVVAGVDKAIGGLPPSLRKEIDQLFWLLAFPPTRSLIAGVWSPWPQATEASVERCLDAWRDSRFTLLRSAYGALHQLVMASWYGNPRSWSAVGYPGPPVIAS